MDTGARAFITRADTVSITDKRLLKGARARETALRRAVDIASLDGLDDVSFGRLATDTGMSKAGIQTLFRSKEVLQLATIDYAREMFIDAVVRPAREAAPGVDRLRALIEHWIEYARTPVFEGGCFIVANIARFDSKPGTIRDALVRSHREWLDTIGKELRNAVGSHEAAELDIDLAVFQIDSVLRAANTALRLGDEDVITKVRRTVENLLEAA
ncbi:TetR/AcrR family transcriptional regulator [Streptomyces sp. TRM S81-3]|uniref:TetR/AcrR family transcriptional regulator n=1 Tax=Streptomyces griseicoloratus TaxID=2752516 RepID=A0A926L0H8_9ACTN|nr:TetR/AcrR family transcriptional regulator [Streptomyces griseicoloratus]MBD0419356.1 TetR/AcrR family transcriptional regulator [Streptomyces griseicoloratus]